MKIAVPRESAPGETRVALTPQAAGQLIGDGVEVIVQAGAGEASYISDQEYADAGATIVPDAAGLYGQADMVVRVGRPTDEELRMLKPGAVLIGTLGVLANPKYAEALARAGVTAISMDAIPRITRAQSMDSLSSQATVGGYKAVLIAAERLPKFFPLLTTAAGTIRPARVLVFGAGVAGLMAVGTARRLGAVVEATDVRPVVKEQVQSLGGTFLEVEMTEEEKAQAETAGGYAREMSEDYKRRQAELIASRVGEADVIITTALIPGRPAPRLVTAEMVKTMRPGSVIVDMAAEMGGNCELTEPGKEIVTDNGVCIIGFTNLPATMPGSATQMYAKNIQTLIKHLLKDGTVELDFNDEITRGATITHQGKVVHEATAQALGIAPAQPTAPSAQPEASESQTDAPAAAGEKGDA
ncbi:MAG TPA: Re/Si-specific NAD(P)(+) transhydrogenase subunit alpha [candidate division Zixibacteria bacterium]|nr:Re/Si-specific NAD(P)(+) transhydrogenase subunit alpha [candidate division Zixibacteria bacterium]